MRGAWMIAVTLGCGACATSPSSKEDTAATPEAALCFRAAVHVAAIMAGKADDEMDQSQMGDIRRGCSAPEAARPEVQPQFHCMLAAADMSGLEACKAASDASESAPN